MKTPEEYEAAFHGITLPDSVDLDSGVHVPDVKRFVELSINILKTGESERVAQPISWRLDRLLELIESKA